MGAVVFDWDGTLVDTLPAILQANIQVLLEYGLPFDEARYRAAYTPDWRRMYRILGVPEEALEAAGGRWLELYRDAGTLAPFPGVGDALRTLRDRGDVIGLVTAGDRSVVEDQLRRFDLEPLIPVLVCGDDPYPAKPDPTPLRQALTELGAHADPTTATYVGDAPDDMRMARAVGARAVGIVGILSTPEDLARAGAHEVHGSVVEWVSGHVAPADREATTAVASPAPGRPGPPPD
jgi:HAD superfamily hydrolase (TIGR01509 family)